MDWYLGAGSGTEETSETTEGSRDCASGLRTEEAITWRTVALACAEKASTDCPSRDIDVAGGELGRRHIETTLAKMEPKDLVLGTPDAPALIVRCVRGWCAAV